jgi:hypothetical protein
MLSYSVSYSMMKGHDFRWVVMASDLVGRTGFEPVTSSVSGCRHSALDSGLAAVTWAYASCALLRLPCNVLRLPRLSSAF